MPSPYRNWPPRPVVNGLTFTEAYGNLGAQVGRMSPTRRAIRPRIRTWSRRPKQQRSQVSGVSLNAEAAKLLQFQQAYQAVGQLVTVLDDLTETLIDMMPRIIAR